MDTKFVRLLEVTNEETYFQVLVQQLVDLTQMTSLAFAFMSPPSVCFHVRTHRMRNKRSGLTFNSSSCERRRTAFAAKTCDNSFDIASSNCNC